MKNSIIKKSLALVLTGAMAFSMPTTASASPITDAYDTVDGNDKNTDTSTSTSTSTTTKTGTIEVPKEVEAIQLNVLGITLDKSDVAIDMSGEKTDRLQARVLFDGYDATGDAENMDWAKSENPITLEQKKAIEDQIHWYSYDNKVATVTAGDDKTKAVITGVSDGITGVAAYIENDGVTYLDENGKAIMRPTEGDFVAYASVAVTQRATGVELALTDVYQKHTYNLKDYTNLMFGENSKPLYECTEDVIYSNLKITSTAAKSKQTKATLKDDGTLKITKGNVGDEITFTMTTSNGATDTARVTVQQDVPATGLKFVDDKGNKVTKGTLDLGKEDWYKDLTVKVATDKDDKTTDDITWTISDKKGTIATITDIGAIDENNYTWATVNAIGEQIGTVKITAKATSGKSASYTLAISATPATAEIYGSESVYTGQTTTLGAVLYGENGLVIPQGKTKFKWSVAVTGNKANAKINSSKGVLTPAVLLTKGSGKSKELMLEDTATVSATFSNSTARINNKKADNTATVRIEQSNVSDVALTAQQVGTDGVSTLGTIASDATKADLKGLFVGTSFDVVPTGNGQLGSIVWSTTGKGIIQNVNGEVPTYTLTAAGNKTVKATYYTIDEARKKATKVVKTFNIKNLVVRAEQLTFDKSAVVVNPTTKATNVTLKIKAQAPKGAADKITWAVKAANDEATELDVKNEKYDKKKADPGAVYYTESGKTSNTIKITLPAGLKAGSVLKVGAFAEGGAVAYSYIYVTEKTNKVLTQLDKNKISVKVSETVTVSPKLEVVNGKTKETKDHTQVKFTLGSTTTAYTTEPVTYSVDKKSARFIKVDQNGNITGLQKGKAKVTIKTISGKKATVNVTVE